jgi:hypothetical protein
VFDMGVKVQTGEEGKLAAQQRNAGVPRRMSCANSKHCLAGPQALKIQPEPVLHHTHSLSGGACLPPTAALYVNLPTCFGLD